MIYTISNLASFHYNNLIAHVREDMGNFLFLPAYNIINIIYNNKLKLIEFFFKNTCIFKLFDLTLQVQRSK